MKEHTVRLWLKLSYPIALALLALLVIDHYLFDDSLTVSLFAALGVLFVAVLALSWMPASRARQSARIPIPRSRRFVLRHRRPLQ